MNEKMDKNEKDELLAWVKQRFDVAVGELIKNGDYDSLLIEAKPAWVYPYQVLIGKVRERDSTKAFEWLICGELPTDSADSSVASTPRAAARYFAMKWQLEVARHQDLLDQKSSGPVPELREPAGQLAETAEALYELADDENLWQQQEGF